ncbi:histidinol dehydrogenase [Candidatus Pelagibacter communis]|uniref:histidinol dehydrogenase n=1 Tax=Pelagibacter ubique TaxID=198252 RepID=UPI00094DA1E7|nr:histidinol dehydrogenase [Candidatus Pelagibacter ubique]
MTYRLDANSKNFQKDLIKKVNKRSVFSYKDYNVAKKIVFDVKENGDKAVLKYEKKFNKNDKLKTNYKNTIKNIKKLNSKVKKSIDFAFQRILSFHKNQKSKDIKFSDRLNNKIDYKYKPLNSVGIYIPGGNASFPSTVLMNAIPAMLAGVKRIVIVNPVRNKDQSAAVLYAAKKCGVKEIYRVGGAQAIAALAYGTKTIKRVDKIVGPGNIYVAAAKKIVFGEVGIDMIAGPSEITVVADKSSNAKWVAADLIGQAEHDINAQCILISKNKKLIDKVQKELEIQLKNLPRKKIALGSLKKNGLFIFANSDKKISDIINIIAPEHLELSVDKYQSILKNVKNAGSICTGKYSAMAVTDYCAGSNHTLPTHSSAKFFSGLSVFDFFKRISYINISKKGIETIGEKVINLATYEGLDGHARSVKLRMGE